MAETKHLRMKIALVGDKAVGKTSLIRRFVLDQFDDRYLLTLGTKVSKKIVAVRVPSRDLVVQLDLSIWDIMGQTAFREIAKDVYFYGARGILAVADLTRRETLDGLRDWITAVEDVTGRVPAVLAVNKRDLAAQAAFASKDVQAVADPLGCEYLMTSAKTGENVEAAFQRLGDRMVDAYLRQESVTP